jgi:CRISPR-associated endoribonuclease Cas6
VLHKWLGLNNPWHEVLSLYSYGWLEGGQANARGLDFPGGARWFVAGYETNFLETLLSGSIQNVEAICGMRVKSVKLELPPRFGTKTTFRVSGPVLLKAPEENGYVRFLTFEDGDAANEMLTHALHRKLEAAGLGDLVEESVAYFDDRYPRPKTRLVDIRGIKNRASACPVVVEGPPEVQRFVWHTGLGHSTGMGFGGVV